MPEVIPFSLGASPDALNDAVQAFFLKETAEKETYYNKYYAVETGVQTRSLRDGGLSGFGQAADLTDNAIITAESPEETNDQTYVQREYGLMGRFTKQMWKFGIQRRDIETVVKDLVQAAYRRREVDCADRLSNALAVSYVNQNGRTVTTTGGDAVAFISAAHPREDAGANWNNRITDGTTVNMDFEYDGLQAAHRTGQLILNPKGQTMDLNLTHFVCRKNMPIAFRAKEILGAINKGKIPSSNENDGAGVPAYEVLELPYMTQNAFWFMFDNSMRDRRYGLQFIESQPVMLEGEDKVFETGEIRYKVTTMYELGHNDARNWVGSNGTNIA